MRVLRKTQPNSEHGIKRRCRTVVFKAIKSLIHYATLSIALIWWAIVNVLAPLLFAITGLCMLAERRPYVARNGFSIDTFMVIALEIAMTTIGALRLRMTIQQVWDDNRPEDASNTK